MFRKSAYQQAGGYRPEFYFAQDVDLWSRLIECGDLGYVRQPLYQVRFDLASITARHRSSQEKLRALGLQAAALRARGESDREVLAQAAPIRPASRAGAQAQPPGGRAAAAYFVGSCLVGRKDPRARIYLLQAIRHAPLHLKSWYKLFQSYWAGMGARS